MGLLWASDAAGQSGHPTVASREETSSDPRCLLMVMSIFPYGWIPFGEDGWLFPVPGQFASERKLKKNSRFPPTH